MGTNDVLQIVISTLTIVAILAIVTLLIAASTRWRFPAVEHACWVVVLLRLIIPPTIEVGIPGFPDLRSKNDSVAFQPMPESDSSQVNQANPVAPQEVNHTESSLAIDDPLNDSEQSANEPRDNAHAADTTVPTAPSPTPVKDAVDTQPKNASAPIAPAIPKFSFSAFKTILGIWLIGCVIVLGRTIRSTLRFRRLLQLSTPASDEVQAIAQSVGDRLGLARLPEIRTLSASIPPLVWSLGGRVQVILPSDLPNLKTKVGQELLLTHELAHVRRRDHRVRLLELAVSTVWWWCPLVWWVRTRLRVAEERACDAWVLRIWPSRAKEYAQAIVDAVGFVGNASATPRLTTGGVGSLREVGLRLRWIQANNSNPRAGMVCVAAFAAFAMTSGQILLTAAQPKAEEPKKQAAAESSLNQPSDAEHPNNAPKAENTPQTVAENQPQQAKDKEPLAKQDSQIAAESLLPANCDPNYAVFSPDKKRIAFIGSVLKEDASRQHGLYCYDLQEKSLHLLRDKAIKTAPAWSPDSKKLAFSDSAGYGNVYPLVVVDVDTRQFDHTNQTGAGTAWSPDGRYIAVSTQFGDGGSWYGGVPGDGRIGLWDTATRKLSYVSRPGINQKDPDRKFRFMTGGIYPIWSPDGEWIAWKQVVSQWSPSKEDVSQTQAWVARPNGKDTRRVFKNTNEFQWSDDSRSLIDVKKNETVEIASIPISADSDWPTMPADLQSLLTKQAEAESRAAEFDAREILDANRLWQNPKLKGILSIEFTHRMQPTRLDERFAWRNDGATMVKVLARDDKSEQCGVGWTELLTADGSRYTFGADDAFPRFFTPKQYADRMNEQLRRQLSPTQIVRRQTLQHLSGTRLNIVALDWGRRPNDFEVTDFTDNGETQTVELRAAEGTHRDARLNIGAMFETSSWAYVPQMQFHRSLLTIDRNRRIVKEVDYLNDKVVAEVELTDWLTTADGQQAPGRIAIHVPEHKFQVDQTFHVVNDKLWILKSGKSQFEQMAAQTEEIVDLQMDAEVDPISQPLSEARSRLEEMNAAAANPPTIRLRGLTPFELGLINRFSEMGEGTNATEFRPTMLRFMPADGSKSEAEIWPGLELVAELQFAPEAATTPADDALLIVLYDEHRQPLHIANLSSAALTATKTPQKDQRGNVISIEERADGNRIVRCNFGDSSWLGATRYWTLTRRSQGKSEAMTVPKTSADEESATAVVIPSTHGQELLIPKAIRGTNGLEESPIRLRSITIRKDDGRTVISPELVSTAFYTEQHVQRCFVAIDTEGTPISGGSGSVQFRTYDNPVRFCESPVTLVNSKKCEFAFLLSGTQSITTGAPMGSRWGMYLSRSPVFTPPTLLGSTYPEIRLAGLRELYRSSEHDADKVFERRNRGRHDLRIVEALLALRGLLQSVLSSASKDSEEAIAIAARLAGLSEDQQFVESLRPLLNHSSEQVRDSAAIGLGLLGNSEGIDRLQLLAEKPAPEHRAGMHPFERRTPTEAKWALSVIKK
jgi:beta-lactamase regulating signal transducer with metallopeptidase domain